MEIATTAPIARAKEGHLPTLIASFLHFDLCFMLWVLLGALGVFISQDLGLSPAQKGLMVAIPTLSGSLLRIPLGLLSDTYGGKRVGIIMLLVLFVPLGAGWMFGTSLPQLLAIGLLLGTAGASFSVALPLASRWYPAGRQGLVMGIAAAGNSGTVLANLFAPRIAPYTGWHGVLGLAMIPLALVLVAFALMAKDKPDGGRGLPLRTYLESLRSSDMWWFCLLYSVTFGGYVGLGTFLPTFFHDQYGVDAVQAGLYTALISFVGSGLRPVGGYVADRVGGVRLLTVLLVGIAAAYLAASSLPPLALMVGLLVVGVGCLGMGNGSVFQLVPQRFQAQIGVATGVVGAVGGVGGFMLPNLLGIAKQQGGSFGPAFVVLAVIAVAALVLLRVLVARSAGWRSAWQG
ncbi:NarK/NasA family nitrate transporter [Chloroflexia bacterium SDU3-3]|nr:NarK/NasA family nitrate transporter [Chloroflexia bacterium SDU3-3]